MKEEIKIIYHGGGNQDLRELTRLICLKTGQSGAGGLGGEYGYGAEFENDTFMMHSYCWCEEDDCKWCNGNEPNFFYKPTNYKLHWYKYIGRGEESQGKLPADWFKKCAESIWDKDDCYYEICDHATNLEEGLFGRKEPSYIILNFNVWDKKALVKAELSPFSEGAVQYWDLDTILSDMRNAQMEETSEYEKAIKLDKKYPNLREKIRQDAIKRHKEQIEWHKRWLLEELK